MDLLLDSGHLDDADSVVGCYCSNVARPCRDLFGDGARDGGYGGGGRAVDGHHNDAVVADGGDGDYHSVLRLIDYYLEIYNH